MKLLIAIVNNDDANDVNIGLNKAEFIATKIASTGGFLMKGNTTFLVGLEEERLDEATEIIARYSKKRVVPVSVDTAHPHINFSAMPAKVTVGGATIFIVDVEKYMHI